MLCVCVWHEKKDERQIASSSAAAAAADLAFSSCYIETARDSCRQPVFPLVRTLRLLHIHQITSAEKNQCIPSGICWCAKFRCTYSSVGFLIWWQLRQNKNCHTVCNLQWGGQILSYRPVCCHAYPELSHWQKTGFCLLCNSEENIRNTFQCTCW